MNSRYDVAMLLRDHWSLLNWKGDSHTQGVYFNKDFGYIIEPTYALRIKHNEPVDSVFYIPDLEDPLEDEVITDYPYKDLDRKINNYRLLYEGPELPENALEHLFKVSGSREVILPVEALCKLLETIPNKRKRDRTKFILKVTGIYAELSLIGKKSEELLASDKIKLYSEHHSNDAFDIIEVQVNANNLFHALNMLKMDENTLFTLSHDKIKIANFNSFPKVEAVMSLLK